jgi:hypothetical protein
MSLWRKSAACLAIPVLFIAAASLVWLEPPKVVLVHSRQAQPGGRTQATSPNPTSPSESTGTADAVKKPRAVAQRVSSRDPAALAAAASRIRRWEPQTPAAVARSFTGAAPRLIVTLADWQRRLANELEPAVAASQLTVAECVRLADLAAGWEATREDGPDDAHHAVTACFVRAAMKAGAREVEANPSEHDALVRLLSPWVRRAWAGGVDDAAALHEFYAMLAVGQTPASPDYYRGLFGQVETLGRANKKWAALTMLYNIEHRRPVDALVPVEAWSDGGLEILTPGGLHAERAHAFSVAKCLFYLDRPLETLAALDSMTPPLGDADPDKDDADFVRVLALVDAGNHRAANVELRRIVSDGRSPYVRDAVQMLLDGSIAIGDAESAQRAFGLLEAQNKMSAFGRADYVRRIQQLRQAIPQPVMDRDTPPGPASSEAQPAPRMLDPRGSIGRRMPYLDEFKFDPSVSLERGRFVLVFYHHDCPQCRVDVPGYLAAARERFAAHGSVRFAFIEVPPYGGGADSEVVPPDPAYLKGSLPAGEDWFVPMLTRVEIRDGQVVRATSYQASAKSDFLGHLGGL